MSAARPASPWRKLLRPGDVLLLVGGLVLTLQALWSMTQGGRPDTVEIRAAGKLVATLELSHSQIFEVAGPLGVTRIEVQPGRARVEADPGPRQYCVRQGWLTQSGAVAICAPNQVSIRLGGVGADYDSLSY